MGEGEVPACMFSPSFFRLNPLFSPNPSSLRSPGQCLTSPHTCPANLLDSHASPPFQLPSFVSQLPLSPRLKHCSSRPSLLPLCSLLPWIACVRELRRAPTSCNWATRVAFTSDKCHKTRVTLNSPSDTHGDDLCIL